MWLAAGAVILFSVLCWAARIRTLRTPKDEIIHGSPKLTDHLCYSKDAVIYKGPLRKDYLPHCPEFLQSNLTILDFYRLGPLDLPCIFFWFVFDIVDVTLGCVLWAMRVILLCVLCVDLVFCYSYSTLTLLVPYQLMMCSELLLYINSLSNVINPDCTDMFSPLNTI